MYSSEVGLKADTTSPAMPAIIRRPLADALFDRFLRLKLTVEALAHELGELRVAGES